MTAERERAGEPAEPSELTTVLELAALCPAGLAGLCVGFSLGGWPGLLLGTGVAVAVMIGLVACIGRVTRSAATELPSGSQAVSGERPQSDASCADGGRTRTRRPARKGRRARLMRRGWSATGSARGPAGPRQPAPNSTRTPAP